MPDLDALYQRFKDQGFVILAISDEEADKVKTFLSEQKFTFPILLNPGTTELAIYFSSMEFRRSLVLRSQREAGGPVD